MAVIHPVSHLESNNAKITLQYYLHVVYRRLDLYCLQGDCVASIPVYLTFPIVVAVVLDHYCCCSVMLDGLELAELHFLLEFVERAFEVIVVNHVVAIK
jgi:hypothetical protein